MIDVKHGELAMRSQAEDEFSLNHRRAFGSTLRHLRLAAGFSQEVLADRARLHRTYIGSVERGERNISLDNIYALARALNVDVRRLFEPQEAQR